jgi:hypothetical protein
MHTHIHAIVFFYPFILQQKQISLDTNSLSPKNAYMEGLETGALEQAIPHDITNPQ